MYEVSGELIVILISFWT